MARGLLDSEWIILKALWNKEPQSLKGIIESIQATQPDVDWSYKTYHSYLRIMLQKGLIGSESKNEKDKNYFPLLTREDALKIEGENLLSRISAKSVGKMMALLVESGSLSDDDQQELLAYSKQLEEKDVDDHAAHHR